MKMVETMVLNLPFIDPLIGTSRIADIINGGVKAYVKMYPQVWHRYRGVNHLPFRLATIRPDLISSVPEVMEVDTKLGQPMAEKFNLSLTAFGNVISDPCVPYYGSAVLSNPCGSQLEPPPQSLRTRTQPRTRSSPERSRACIVLTED